MASSSATKFVLAVLLVLSSCLSLSRCAEEPNCPPLPCGKLGSLGRPFVNSANTDCGYIVVEGCDQTNQSIQLRKGSGKWYDFLEFSLNDSIVHLRDPELDRRLRSSNQCQALNDSSLPQEIRPTITLLKCKPTTNLSLSPLPHSDFQYKGCEEYDIYYNQISKPPPLPLQSCSILQLPVANNTVRFSNDLFGFLVSDFFLQGCSLCLTTGRNCEQDNQGNFVRCATKTNKGSGKARRKPVIGLAIAAVLVAVIALLVYCFWIRSMSNTYFFFWKKNKSHRSVEAILKTYGSFAPKRYTYSEVKKFTNSFKNKLGEGGYGGVYQGTLPDSRAIAVKVLKESKGSGEEFINEVASISRTSHVNIVTLMGFCFERTKRALVYEFMPNGSLEKFIYDENIKPTTRQLGWETLFQIALGIARGLEYLHRGCNTRIVHFDIKPHNILLDEEFCPKIADFGLSKLCSNRKDSILSMLGARGTPGYAAPEVFCRTVGNVSHKSDVYSYGMMVLEMVGGRKNFDVGADHTSEIYFPHWIHGRLHRGSTELELHGIVDEEEKLKALKMIIIGLWCIQTDPNNRPAMHGVLDMFQGSIEYLQIPPLPVMSSSTTHHS